MITKEELEKRKIATYEMNQVKCDLLLEIRDLLLGIKDCLDKKEAN